MKKLIAVLVILMAAALIVATYSAQTAPVAVATPQEALQLAKDQEAQQRALIGAMSLRSAMRNPESFKLASAFVTKSGAACLQIPGAKRIRRNERRVCSAGAGS